MGMGIAVRFVKTEFLAERFEMLTAHCQVYRRINSSSRCFFKHKLEDMEKSPSRHCVLFPVVIISRPTLLVVLTLLHAISYYGGLILLALRKHNIRPPSISRFRPPTCDFKGDSRNSFVEFVSCPEHRIDIGGGIASTYRIDSYEDQKTRIVSSWNKTITSHSTVYYEAMVHPALLVHDNPRRILLMNDVTGGMLREVLKHSTVHEVIYISPSAKVVSLEREYLPEWSDCISYLANVSSCFDDPRVRVQYYDDPMTWFQSSMTDRIDVVLADATT